MIILLIIIVIALIVYLLNEINKLLAILEVHETIIKDLLNKIDSLDEKIYGEDLE